MAGKTIFEKFPVDRERFGEIIREKFGTVKTASDLIGKSNSFFCGQFNNGGFDKSTVLLVEKVLGIPYEEYELKIEDEKGDEREDPPKNEVVAYAREITRLNNLYRELWEEFVWLNYRCVLTNEAVIKLLDTLGVDTTEFQDKMENDAFYPDRKEIEE